MSNTLKLTLVATLFNVLFEYSLRGINTFVARPFFIVIMFTAYFTLFAMQDALIRRFHLRDYHLFILAFTYGVVYQCLYSGIAFVEPTFLGLNWREMLFTVVFWWGTVQSVLTFYLANRIVRRDWSEPPLSRAGWVIVVLLNLFVIFLFQRSPEIPRGQPIGYVMMVVIFAAATLVLYLTVRRRKLERRDFEPNLLMDVLSAASVLLFLYAAFFLTHDPVAMRTTTVNATSARLIAGWTVLVTFIIWGARALRGRSHSI